MKSSTTQIITVTHISEVSLFRHDLSHFKVLKSMSSSALLLEHFFNRTWTESPQYLKEYNTQSSGLLMIVYFFMYPESTDPEETGLNSSHPKYLLIPYFKQLWFSGFTGTTQSNAKLRQPDSPISVYLLYVFRIYSWMLQIERGFLKTCSLLSKSSIQVHYQTEIYRLHPREVWATGCCLVLFIIFISTDSSWVANPTSRHPSDEGLLYSQRSNMILISPVQKSVTHPHQLLLSRCQGFTSQPEVHADLQISSNSFSLGSLVYHPTFDIQIPIFKFHVFTYRVLRQANWQRSCNYPV